MSKLDDILTGVFQHGVNQELLDYYLATLPPPKAKQQIKELFKQACDDLYASGDLPPTVYAMLIVKVEEL